MTVSPFGVYLREKRVEAGRSLREVADALGISHVYLGEVERGRRRALPHKYWSTLAAEIEGVSVPELRRAAAASEPLDPAGLDGPSRNVVIALARTLEEDGMSEDLANRLLAILGRDRENSR